MLAAISEAQRARMRLVLFERAQERPHGERDGERQDARRGSGCA